MRRPLLDAVLTLIACTVTAFWASASNLQGTSWPRFRGANGDGISPATALLKSWPESGPEVLWKVALGGGFSGLAIVDGRIYTSYSREDSEYVAAIAATDGRLIWAVRTDRERKDNNGNGPRSTPLVDGGLVYAVLGLAPRDGKVLWRYRWKTAQDINAATPVFVPPDRLFISSGNDSGAALYKLTVRDGELDAAIRNESNLVCLNFTE